MEDELETTTNTPPVQPAPLAPPPATPPAPPVERVLGSNGQPLSEETIRERAERAKRQVLVAEFGTDDPAKIAAIKAKQKADQEELARLRRVEEQRKRRSMSEQERVAAELAKERAEKEAAKAELLQMKRGLQVEKQDRVVHEVATKHIAPEHMRYARRDLAEHLKSLPPADQKKFDQAKLDRWFEKYAKEKPFFAKAPPTTETPPAAPPAAPPAVRRAPIARPDPPPNRDRKVVPGTNLAGKTPKPGLPNSMTKQELAEYKKAQGYSF